MKRKRTHRDSLDTLNIQVVIATGVVFTLAVLALVLPRILSNDICLRDWDFECTSVPNYVQFIYNSSFPLVFLFYGLFFATLAITTLNIVSRLFAKFSGKSK